MVIVIIGVLAGLLLFAVGGGTKKAKNAAVLSEIEQIQSAIETYRTERGSYPPTLGIFVGDGALGSGPPANPKWPVAQQNRVLRHVAKAFPRYIPASGFASLRDDISVGTSQVSWTIPNTSKLNSGLDMEHLDPAETLVFFLGGLPNPNSETKLAPLRLDPASPFKDPKTMGPDHYGGQRGKVFFPFDARRLVDYDQDGWWEYLPPGGTQEGNTPPYVYFDSNIYKSGPAYPYPSVAGSIPRLIGPTSNNESQWGNCIPYCADPPPTGTQPLKFVNSQKFQIIAAGFDNKYDEVLKQILNPPTDPWWFTPEFFPSTVAFQEEDKDNLTNFAGGTLADSAPTP